MRRFSPTFTSFFILVFILIGCENENSIDQNKKKNNNHSVQDENNEVPSQNRLEFSHEGQHFQIISLFVEVLNYTTNRVQKDNKSADKEEVYYNSEVKPFMKEAQLNLFCKGS